MENPEHLLKMQPEKEPDAMRVEIENNVASSVESKRKIALETGKFYNSLIDTYLEAKTPEEQLEQTSHLIEELPNPMKKLYNKGLKVLQEELEKNYSLLEQHRGNEVRYLLSILLNRLSLEEQEISAEQIKEILQHADMAQFIEPSPGVAVIQASENFFGLLKKFGIFTDGTHAVCFNSNNPDEPSFLMFNNVSPEQNFTEDSSEMKKDSAIRHELHHFIWNFLQKRAFTRGVYEAPLESIQAFANFRHEVAAYIIGSLNETLGIQPPENLAHTKDDESLKLASDARDFAEICIEITEQKGVDKQSLLYAVMTSRDFDELKDNFAVLTPLDKIDRESVVALYSAWSHNRHAPQKIAEFLERKNLTVPASLIEEYGLSRMVSADITSMDDIYSESDDIKEFAGAVHVDSIDWGSLTDKAMRVYAGIK